ncbi:hypothetical protein SUDANB95_01754 [Actinosynnema sp. ALI-1.44]
MKVSPRADFPVSVRPWAWEAPEATAHLYDGVYLVTLNNVVSLAFVPDSGPPWDDTGLPHDFDDITTPRQARVVAALSGGYAVAPHPELAGTAEPYEPAGAGAGVVFYVTPEEFARYQDDLEALSATLGSVRSTETVSGLRDHEVVRFLDRVVASGLLAPEDSRLLGQDSSSR